ncbi:MAG: redoxin domain-containing protein [Nannocystaceae bacterium]
MNRRIRRITTTACLCLGFGGCASPPTNPEPKVPDAAVSPADASEAAENAGDSGVGPGQVPEGASESGDASVVEPAPVPGSEVGTTGTGETGGAPVENGADTPNQPSDSKSPAAVAKAKPGLPPPLFKKVDNSCGKDPGVGTAAKPMRLPSTNGKTIDLKAYKRRVVLLNFWGTWCKPCLKELPEFSRLYRRYRKYGLTLIAVATDDDAEAVDLMVKERKIAGKIVVGGQKLADDYRSPNFPFSFVVAPGGKISGSYRRYRPECMGKLEDDIRTELLKLQG